MCCGNAPPPPPTGGRARHITRPDQDTHAEDRSTRDNLSLPLWPSWLLTGHDGCKHKNSTSQRKHIQGHHRTANTTRLQECRYSHRTRQDRANGESQQPKPQPTPRRFAWARSTREQVCPTLPNLPTPALSLGRDPQKQECRRTANRDTAMAKGRAQCAQQVNTSRLQECSLNHRPRQVRSMYACPLSLGQHVIFLA